MKNILVAYDGSPMAQRGLSMGIEMARALSTHLHVLHVNVVPPNLLVQSNSAPGLIGYLNEVAEKVVAQAQQTLTDAGIDAEVSVVASVEAPQAIDDFAKEHDCDLIIIGSRGLSGIRSYLGSVSHALLNESHIPVLVVKDAGDEKGSKA